MRKLTKEEFINRARETHGDKYDYSKVEYINSGIKVCIICPEHGEFWQNPSSHLNGNGCKKCFNENRSFGIDYFIKNASIVHNKKYDYSKVEYKNDRTKICIICPEHGEFFQTPRAHLQGQGCPKCWEERKGKSLIKSTEKFIEDAKNVHGNKYDYSKVIYEHSKKKICIICSKHGEFWQTPNDHLRGFGCPECGIEKTSNAKRLTTDKFIFAARKIHCDIYDYSKVDYKSAHEKVCIICPKHGEFWQEPSNHLNGAGCPSCKETNLEKNIREKLEELNINSFYQYRDSKILGQMSIDFYLPDYNVGIECQGIQHFEPVDFAGKGKEWARNLFSYTKEHDKEKYNICKSNGIDIIYFITESKYFGSYGNEIHSVEELLPKLLSIKPK